jgi:hypothetical protein
MIQIGDQLVPTGFLGMPMLVAPFEWIWNGLGAYVVILLVLSSAYALFRLSSSLGQRAAWAATIVYLTFPILILYENRSFFPNLPVVALGIWAVWLFKERKTNWQMALGGFALGAALIIRPIEAIWLLPWIAWALLGAKRSALIAPGVITIAVCVFAGVMGTLTYGGIGRIGYWTRDISFMAEADRLMGADELDTPPATSATQLKLDDETLQKLQSVADQMTPVQQEETKKQSSLFLLLPFGIHPRAMWSNIEIYLFGILGPWVASALAGFAMWGAIRFRKKQTIPWMPIALTGWTIAMLLLFYGQSRYADNINQTATIGNSFLRYLLPLVPLIGVGSGLLVESLWNMSERKRFLAAGLVGFLAIYGIVTACVRDEESIFPVRQQLIRYEEIRTVARAMLPPGTIVLSERSDKIFAGLDVVAVSPIPDQWTLDRLTEKWLTESDVRIALFHRMLTPEQKETFAGGLVKDWLLVSVFDNEALYLSRP